MALSNKHKKRIDKKFVNITEELEFYKKELWEFKNTIYTTLASITFALFCVVMLFDQIVGKIFFPYIKISKGFGYFQGILAVACIGILFKIYVEENKRR